MGRNLKFDIIAVWVRKSDKLELHLRRDGKCFYYYPKTKDRPEGEWEDASTNGQCSIESVESWIAKGETGAGFEREIK